MYIDIGACSTVNKGLLSKECYNIFIGAFYVNNYCNSRYTIIHVHEVFSGDTIKSAVLIKRVKHKC